MERGCGGVPQRGGGMSMDTNIEMLASQGWKVLIGGIGGNRQGQGFWVQVRREGRIFHCEQETLELAITDAVKRCEAVGQR